MANFPETFEALPNAMYSYHLDEAPPATNAIDTLGLLDGVYHDNVLQEEPSVIVGIDYQVGYQVPLNSWLGHLGTIPYSTASTTTSFAMIVKGDSTGAAQNLISSTRDSSNYFWQVQRRASGTILIYIRGSSSALEIAYETSGYSLPTDREVMLLVTRDVATGWHVYVDNEVGDATDLPLTQVLSSGGLSQADWINYNYPGQTKFQFGLLRRDTNSGAWGGNMSYIGGVDATITPTIANSLNAAFWNRPFVPTYPIGHIGTEAGNDIWWLE